jgi:DNA-binding transcriptional regulator YdaS (Cro superfamily)
MEKFTIYWRSLPPRGKLDFARNCGVQYIYFSQLASGHGQPSPRLAVLIEHYSGGAVTTRDTRPDVFIVQAANDEPAAA